MPWGLEPGSLGLPASPSRAGPVLPCPAPPRRKGSPCPAPPPASAPRQGHAVTGWLFPSAPPPHSLLLRDAASYQSHLPAEGRAGGCIAAKRPLPVELEIRSVALTPDPACSPPCALPQLSLCSPAARLSVRSGSSSHSPHQSPCTRAVDTQAAGRWAVGESISLPLIYRGPGAPDHQAVRNFSSVHVSPK